MPRVFTIAKYLPHVSTKSPRIISMVPARKFTDISLQQIDPTDGVTALHEKHHRFFSIQETVAGPKTLSRQLLKAASGYIEFYIMD